MVESTFKDKNGRVIKEGDFVVGCPTGWKEPRPDPPSKVEWTGDLLQVHTIRNGYDYTSPLSVWLKVAGCGYEEVVEPTPEALATFSTVNK